MDVSTILRLRRVPSRAGQRLVSGGWLSKGRGCRVAARPRERLLHVARSLYHDRAPANRHGLASVWINRRHGRPGSGATPVYHDRAPANRHGLASVWINRRHGRPGWGATPEPAEKFNYALEFPSMEAFAAAVRESRPR